MTCGNNEALGLLVNASGIDVNIVDKKGRSALHEAASDNNIEALEQLLDVSSIDVNIVDNDGQNAVHRAVIEATFGHWSCCSTTQA